VSEEKEKAKREPLRRCVGCGGERPKAELIRLVAHEGRVIVDYYAKLPGRGAYVCPQRECITRAMKRHRLERAFKLEGNRLEYHDLPEQIRRAIKQQILNLLGRAARAGRLISGWNEVKRGLRQARLVLVAADAAESAKRRFADERAFILLSKRELGAAIGKPERSVIAITDDRLAAALRRELERYRAVG